MRLSLAQQIAQLEEVAPAELDLEGSQTFDADERDIDNLDPAAKEHYVEVGPSTLRKLHDGISDPKYDGVKTTRKRLLQEISESEASEIEDEDVMDSDELDDNLHEEDQTFKASIANNNSLENSEDHEKPPLVSQNAMSTKSARDHRASDDLTSTLQKTRDEDRRKGRAISQQIVLWDTLLDARIRMQKSTMITNKLPEPSELRSLLQSHEYDEDIRGMMEEAIALSNELFEVQEDLLTSNELTTVPPSKRRRIQLGDEAAVCLDEAAQIFSTIEQSSHFNVVQTLSKWSSKIQAVAPSALLPSNRNAFMMKHSQESKSVVQLIDDTLTDHDKLLARTRVRRGNNVRASAKEDVVEDGEVFDDTDFYQQLLRDVIDARGNGTSGADDWMAVQRQKKAKKNVDTKASKGRKIRYEVHEKLQNFMVPVPVVGAWHEEQIDELFSSLLGKGFKKSMDHLDEEEHDVPEVEKQLEGALQDGFRVFG